MHVQNAEVLNSTLQAITNYMSFPEVKFHSVITAFLDESLKNYETNYFNNE